MKWCMFANRRCCGEECTGWISDNCFVFLLLPFDYGYGQQREFNWSKYALQDADANDSTKDNDDQLSFLDELERQIARRGHG